MRGAKRQALLIAFRKRVGKPHHTMPIAAVTEAIRMAKFVDRFSGSTFEEQGVSIPT
jgi:hypothetical protein